MIFRTAYIGLGANLPSLAGEPSATLDETIHRLQRLGILKSRSSYYQTQPVGFTDQPSFFNAAIALETSLSPLQLLEELLCIEREFGRDRAKALPKGPRTLDLDLLLMEDLVLKLPQLTLPHPELARRRFVLAPLAEIAPGERHPLSGQTVAALLAGLPDEGENRGAAVSVIQPYPSEKVS